MQNNNLFVVFHASAQVDPQKQAELMDATFEAAPRASFCYNPSERELASSKRIYSQFINSSDKAEAIETISRAAKDQKVVIVTLCQEMMKAAGENDINVVTLTPPEVSVQRCHVSASPEYVSHALKAIAYQR